MRLPAPLALVFSLALPCLGAQQEFTGPVRAELPVLSPVSGPRLDPLSVSPAVPQLTAPSAGVLTTVEDTEPKVEGPSLSAELGLKQDSALAPVSDSLSAPQPGAEPSAGKIAADADWQTRMGEKPLNIVLAAAESVPLIKTGGLADVIDAIGRGFAARGHQVTLFLPKHAQINTRGIVFRQREGEIPVPVAGRIETATLHEGVHEGVRIILIENDGFFKRDAPYGGVYGDFADSDERFIFFSRAILEASKALDLKADVFHAHDWHAALVAPMLKLLYKDDPALSGAKAVLTLHNVAYQGNFEGEKAEKAGFGPEVLDPAGRFNFLHAGIRHADAVTTVSPTYAQEIQNDPEFGFGLEGVLKSRSKDLHGIVNGVDMEIWDPETDGILGRGYGPDDVTLGKAAAKKAFQGHTGLDLDPSKPIFAVASRLAHQKGLDLVAEIAPKLVEMGAQVVITGSGDPALEKAFAELAAAHPRSVFIHGFDELFVRRVFAAADFLLMPSRFEPCGLAQLMAQRYGTLPIVTRTGGLADTVIDAREDPARGDGFFVSEFSPEALAEAARAAIAHFKDPAALEHSRRAAAAKDSSWGPSVARYVSLFRSLFYP